MARRKAAEETTVETVEVETPTEENTVSENTEAVEVENTEAVEAKAPEVEADLTDFEAALEAGADSADPETGNPSEEAVANLNKAYQSIPNVKGKNRARQIVEDKMKHALVEENDMTKAKAFVALRERLVSGSSSSPKAPADPTKAFAAKVAALVLAKDLIQTDIPEGVSDDWTAKVTEALEEAKGQVADYKAWIADTDPEKGDAKAGPVVRAAFKLIDHGPIRVPFTGTRRSVVTHMEQAFADVEPGTFMKVSELTKVKTKEYGDDSPSAGALSSRLFPKGKEPFENDTFRAVEIEGNKGAIKL